MNKKKKEKQTTGHSNEQLNRS